MCFYQALNIASGKLQKAFVNRGVLADTVNKEFYEVLSHPV